MAPASGPLSVYRGQARTGIGEGPGRSTTQGEQYLAAEPPLDGDAEWLDAIRPWMTLDSTPRDHETLGDRLEAWACLPVNDRYLVIRLTAAGIYNRRAAYFAHGRAWPLAAVAADVDPGAWLGCESAFDQPWRDERPPATEPPPHVPTIPDAEQTIQLIAHLYQSRVGGYPVILAAPLADFARGSRLHELVSFARAALPLRLKRDARVRIYTRLPDHYLRRLSADFIAIPEDDAGTALSARRDATLLDRAAQRVEGRELEAGVLRYAEEVVKCAQSAPGALLSFAGRVDRVRWASRIPEPSEAVAVPFVYSVAGQDDRALGAFVRALFETFGKTTASIDWQGVLDADDLAACAPDDLVSILLAEAGTDDARALQRLVAAAARTRGLDVSDRVVAWWRSSGRGRPGIQRLLELLQLQLVSPAAAGPLLREVSGAELAAVVESAPTELREALLDLTETGDLPRDWLGSIGDHVSDDVFAQVARRVLRLAARDDQWRRLGYEYVRRLATRATVPSGLGEALAALPTPALDNVDDYLALVDVLARIDHPQVADRLRPLVAALTTRRSDFGGSAPELADRALQHTSLLRLNVTELLRLESLAQGRPGVAERFAERVDEIVANDPAGVTRQLLDNHGWLRWRLHSRLPQPTLAEVGLQWLHCHAGAAPIRWPLYLEDWRQAMKDVAGTLTATDVAAVRAVAPIEGFQDEQFRGLCDAARDVAALVELGHRSSSSELRAATVARILEVGARPNMLSALVPWLNEHADLRPSYGEPLGALDGCLAGAPSLRLTDHAAVAAAERAFKANYRNIATVIAPAVVNRETLVSRLRAAMLAPNAADPVWRELDSRLAVKDGERILVELARAFEADKAPATTLAWGIFLRAARSYPRLVGPPGDEETLPALQLGLALNPHEGVGRLCLQLLDPSRRWWDDVAWWSALLRGIVESPGTRRVAPSRPDTAYLVLGQMRDLLGRHASVMDTAMKGFRDSTVEGTHVPRARGAPDAGATHTPRDGR